MMRLKVEDPIGEGAYRTVKDFGLPLFDTRTVHGIVVHFVCCVMVG
jgi:hypothetical protein